MRAYRSLKADVESVDVKSGDSIQSCRTFDCLAQALYCNPFSQSCSY
jgi:hypothetical protein